MSLSSCQLGIPWEVFETLDPALREALLEKRIAPEELPELAGWVDEDDEGTAGRDRRV
jgi:hypothetical protein